MNEMVNVTEIRDRIAAALESERANFIADTARLVQFETVSGGEGAVEAAYREQIPRAIEFLRTVSERMGFAFRSKAGRWAEIAWEQPGHGRPTIGVPVHIDVVSVSPGWTHKPFSGDIADGYIWGRGTQDDKGPLMMALYGLYAVKKAGIELPVDVRIIVGTCEEIGDWEDIAEYLGERGAPDFGFTPDATFPLTTGEKGMVTIEFSAEWSKGEPDADTGLEFRSLAGGTRSNIVPDKCEVRLGYPGEKKAEVMRELMRAATDFTVQNPKANVTLLPQTAKSADASPEVEVTFLGKAAHGSTPEVGHNAAVDALAFFGDVATLPAGVRAFTQFLHMVGRELDGSNLMAASSHPFVGRTTVNLGVVDVGPSRGTALLNVRPTMGLTVARVLELATDAAGAWTEATGLTVHAKIHGKAMDAIFMDPDSPKVSPYLPALQAAFSAVTGREATLQATGGTTYAKALPVCCAFGPILPGTDTELAHQVDERIAIESLMRNATIYGTSFALMK